METGEPWFDFSYISHDNVYSGVFLLGEQFLQLQRTVWVYQHGTDNHAAYIFQFTRAIDRIWIERKYQLPEAWSGRKE